MKHEALLSLYSHFPRHVPVIVNFIPFYVLSQAHTYSTQNPTGGVTGRNNQSDRGSMSFGLVSHARRKRRGKVKQLSRSRNDREKHARRRGSEQVGGRKKREMGFFRHRVATNILPPIAPANASARIRGRDLTKTVLVGPRRRRRRRRRRLQMDSPVFVSLPGLVPCLPSPNK